MERIVIAPSILSADFSELGAAAIKIEASGADWIHLDVMDGRFVPNLTFGPKAVADLRKHSSLPFDVHLMTEHPETLVGAFAASGADWITFHHEAVVHAHRLVQEISSLGKKAGVSIVPSTPVGAIEPLLPFVDLVLVMTVNPGFGGQVLIPECLEKTRLLSKIREERGFKYRISVDGGVNRATRNQVFASGVDTVVAGSAFFGASDPQAEVRFLREGR